MNTTINTKKNHQHKEIYFRNECYAGEIILRKIMEIQNIM